MECRYRGKQCNGRDDKEFLSKEISELDTYNC